MLDFVLVLVFTVRVLSFLSVHVYGLALPCPETRAVRAGPTERSCDCSESERSSGWATRELGDDTGTALDGDFSRAACRVLDVSAIPIVRFWDEGAGPAVMSDIAFLRAEQAGSRRPSDRALTR